MVACSPVAVAGCGLAVRVEGVSKLVVGAVGETGRIGSGVAGVVLPVPGVFGFHMRVWCSFRGKSWGRGGLAEGSRRLNVHYTQSYAPMFAGKGFPCGNLFAFWAEPRRVRRRGVRLGLQLRRRVGAAIPKKWSRQHFGRRVFCRGMRLRVLLLCSVWLAGLAWMPGVAFAVAGATAEKAEAKPAKPPRVHSVTLGPVKRVSFVAADVSQEDKGDEAGSLRVRALLSTRGRRIGQRGRSMR